MKRSSLEQKAINMIMLSMEYNGVPESEIREELETLTDDELLQYVAER